MKIFRNPIVVGLLAIVALAVVVHALWPVLGPAVMPHTNRSATAAPIQASATPHPRPTPATIAAAAGGDPEPLLLQTNWPRWAGSPRRDPFHSPNASNASSGAGQPVPAWKLKGIWRQNGVALAAINHRICRSGDLLDGYTVTAISDNEVSLEKDGQNVSVSFGFGNHSPAAAPRPK